MKKTDPEFVGEMIKEFARKTRQRDLNEAQRDLSCLQVPGNQAFKFAITIAGDSKDWESFTTGIEVEAVLAEALKAALLKDRKDHPGWMDPKYFTVEVITLSGKKILLPQNFWEDTLHEVMHELGIHHLDQSKLTVFGLEDLENPGELHKVA